MSVGYRAHYRKTAKELNRPLFTVDFDARHLKGTDDQYQRTIQGVLDPRHEPILRSLMTELFLFAGESVPLCRERDIEKSPYSADEARVVIHLASLFEGKLGAGDDPIGFLIASHAALVDDSKRRAGITEGDANGAGNTGK